MSILRSVRHAIDETVWTATALPGPALKPLSDDLNADVAIVGAGYTGLSAAIALAAKGTSVVVLDSGEIGVGASGRNGGQINPGLKLDPDDAVKALGSLAEDALRFAGAAPDKVFELVDRYGIDCNIRRTGWLMPAHREAAQPMLDARANGWRRRGVEVQSLSRCDVQRLTGSAVFAGGIVDPRGGNLQPLSYVRGLAKAALGEGARIFTRSPVSSLRRVGQDWLVASGKMSVSAKRVIIATNGYTDNLWPGLKKTIVPIRSFQIATVPLDASTAKDILPEGHHAADTRHLIRYFRKDPAGRVMLGGQGNSGGPKTAEDFSHLYQAILVMYPQLRGVDIDYAWSGVVAVTPDYLPHVHELAPGLTAVLGYNGRGVAMATALGQSVARHLLEDGSPIGIAPTAMKKVPFHALNKFYAAIAERYFHRLDRE